MSLEEAIFTHLKNDAGVAALVGTRIFPLEMHAPATLPAIVYQRIDGVPRNHMRGGTTKINARIQIDCYGEEYADAKAVAAAVRTAMNTWPAGFKALLLSDRDFEEERTALKRVLMEFSVWGDDA